MLALGGMRMRARVNGRAPGGAVREKSERPSRGEIDPVAFDLIARRGPEIMASARRWSATPEDAEDAYQRGLEILLTKAPTTAEDELVPWLKTVVKHEALAVRRQRERAAPVTADGEPAEPRGAGAAAHDQAELYERLRQGAEALRRLKPPEVRCLLLRAEGYTYEQICEITGFSFTKVNRCLSEGRRAFFERVRRIEAGAECERLAPLLSTLADGEAGAEELAALRPHLRTCLACRARLRDYRAVPERVAGLVPPALAAASGGGSGDGPGALRSVLESIVGFSQDKATAFGERAHAAVELASAQKVAAVAASAAALAGGGAAGVEQLRGDERARPAKPPAPVEQVKQEVEPPPVAVAPAPEPVPAPAPPAPEPVSPKLQEPEPRADPAAEFAPGPQPAPPPEAAPAPAPSPAGSFAPGGAAGSGGGGGGGEFGP